MPNAKLPMPKLGIDNVSNPAHLPDGAVLSATNVDIDRDGVTRSRRGAQTVVDRRGLHSLYGGAHGALVACDASVYRVDLDSNKLSFAGSLNSNDPVSYADVPQGTVAMNRTTALLVPVSGQGRDLAPPAPPAPGVAGIDGGMLAGGRYGVAISYTMGGIESGLSPAAYLDLNAGEGIQIASLPRPETPDVTGVRIYRTTANGSILYRAGDAAPGGQFLLGDKALGRAADNSYLRAFSGGDIVRAWNGRILVADGSTLWLGEPFRHGLFNPATGFIQRPSPITMLAVTDNAIFVATAADTVALIGRSPDQMSVNRVNAGVAFPHSDCQLALDSFSGDWASSGSQVSTWLTTQGYVVGMPDGTVISPQKKRTSIDGPLRRVSTAFIGNRLFSG